jgi:SOS-response transcriptional repressor LexA
VLEALEKKGYIERISKGASRGIKILETSTKKQAQALQAEGIKPITIVGEGTPGNPLSVFMSPRGQIRIDTQFFEAKGDVFASVVADDGASADGFMRGDIVIVKSERNPKTGEMVLVLTNNGQIIRRLKKSRNAIEFISEAKGFPSIKTTKDDESYSIIGTVIGLLRTIQ